MPEQRLRILVADDSVGGVEQLTAILSDAYDISVALSGPEALTLAPRLLPDLILLDIMMPGMDGYTVCEALKADDRTRHIPVIYITALRDSGDESRGFASGAVDFISKPFTPELVLARVRTHLHLYCQSRHLESLVQERTRELTAAKAKAEQADAAKTMFLSNMSHELRTPLNGVLGIAQLLLGEEQDAGRLELLEHLRDAGNHLLHIVNDLLELSNIERGVVDIVREPVELEELLLPLADSCRAQAMHKGLAFQMDIAPGVRKSVETDKARLRQVLVNLLDNALKFTPHGQVALSIDTHTDSHGAAFIRFHVRDTGIGIAPDRIGAIFGRFAIAEDHLTKQYGGCGLGLSIAHELAVMMGGTITVDSREGKGSAFTLSLPLSGEADETQEATPPDDQRAYRNCRVLLVEDEPVSRMMAQRLLSVQGHAVTIAENGRQALDILSAQPFDVVVMDLQMPVLNGLDAIRIIRATHPGIDPGIPVVGLSAYAADKDIRTALDAGFSDYLCKPFEPDELAETIQRVLPRP